MWRAIGLVLAPRADIVVRIGAVRYSPAMLVLTPLALVTRGPARPRRALDAGDGLSRQRCV
jgi:hypothetical protein